MTRAIVLLGMIFVAIAGLFRWRAQGIRDAIDRLQAQEAERIRRMQDDANKARADQPVDPDDIIKRLREAGRLRD